MKDTTITFHGRFAFKRGPKARLQKEALILRRLSHPNIIKLETIYKDHLVLPKMQCHLSHEAIGAYVTPSQLATGMLDAVAYLHSQHIIHADIKPGNILCEPGRAVLCDFGVSMFLNAVNEFPVQSDPYRSPYPYVGPHLDLWPLGQIILTYCGSKWAPIGRKCQEKDVMAPNTDYAPLKLKTERDCEMLMGIARPSYRKQALALNVNDSPLIHDILYRYFARYAEKCWSARYVVVYHAIAKTLCGDESDIWLL